MVFNHSSSVGPQCDFMLKSYYVHTDKYDTYACNKSDLADGYIFKILDLNLPTSNSHQWRNALKRFHNRDKNEEVFITYGRGVWFSITALYETTTHINSYRQVAFHKLASINVLIKILMNPQSVLFSTSSSPPSMTMSTLVRQQKRWMNKHVLHSLIYS